MEDALALCFQPETRNFLDFVLILVLMEDALALQVANYNTLPYKVVLILVLMEDALAHYKVVAR